MFAHKNHQHRCTPEYSYFLVEQVVSISPTFYEQVFCTKVFCEASLCLQFGFVLFWQKEIDTKAARNVLVKLTTAPYKLVRSY